MSGVPTSQVSRLCEEVDARVKTFLDRPAQGRLAACRIDSAARQWLRVRLSFSLPGSLCELPAKAGRRSRPQGKLGAMHSRRRCFATSQARALPRRARNVRCPTKGSRPPPQQRACRRSIACQAVHADGERRKWSRARRASVVHVRLLLAEKMSIALDRTGRSGYRRRSRPKREKYN